MSSPDATHGPAPAPPRATLASATTARPQATSGRLEHAGRRGLLTLSLLGVAGLWLVTRPYEGIIHDSTLYTLQALSDLHPTLRQDVFVSESFQKAAGSLFNTAYATLIARLGLIPANLGLTLVAGLAWVGALILFCRSIIAGRNAQLAAVVAVLTLSPLYSGDVAFAYGERFITARLPAEACALLGLASWASGRRLLAVAILVLACALHPLMGVGALAIVFVQAAWADRRWLGLPLVVAVAALPWGLLHGPQVVQLLTTSYDPAWDAVVRLRDPCCFVGVWDAKFWASAAACVAVLVFAWRFASKRERLWIASTMAVGLLGVAATLVGSDLLKNVFVTSAQPWRALWLMVLLGNAWIGVLLVRLPRSHAAHAMLGWAAFGSMLSHFGLALVPAAQFLLLSLGVAWIEARRGALEGAVRRLAVLIVPSVVLFCLSGTLVFGLSSDNRAQILAFAGQVALSGGFVACLLLLVRARSSLPAFAMAVLLVVAAVSFDRRTFEQRHLGAPATAPGMADLVGPGRNVYWSGATRWMWFDLKRPVYFSCAQGAGALFSRTLSDSFSRKAQALAPLQTQDFSKGSLCESWGAADPAARVSAYAVATACRALPDLDAVILPYHVTGLAAAASWQPPVEPGHDVPTGAGLSYHRYECSTATRANGDPGAEAGGVALPPANRPPPT